MQSKVCMQASFSLVQAPPRKQTWLAWFKSTDLRGKKKIHTAVTKRRGRLKRNWWRKNKRYAGERNEGAGCKAPQARAIVSDHARLVAGRVPDGILGVSALPHSLPLSPLSRDPSRPGRFVRYTCRK